MTQQLTTNSKKSRFGPKIGTQDWWLNKIKQEAGHKKVQPAAKPIEKVQVQVSTEEPPADEEGLFGALDSSSHSSDKGHRFLKYNSKAKTISIQVTGLTTQV